jgi:hypothetical protein
LLDDFNILSTVFAGDDNKSTIISGFVISNKCFVSFDDSLIAVCINGDATKTALLTSLEAFGNKNVFTDVF